jgi:hypothetical protein
MGNEEAPRNANVNFSINVQPVGSQDNNVQSLLSGLLPKELRSSIYGGLEKISSSITTTIKESLGTLSLVTGGSLYALLYYKLYTARKLLKNPTSWCCWKQHCALDHLAAQDAQELSDQLLLDIQARYMNIEDPTNNTAPITVFLPALNKELVQLERYCYWAKRLMSLYCGFALGVNKKTYEKAQEGIARLRFIKKIFVRWWAAHNVQRTREGETTPTRNRPVRR